MVFHVPLYKNLSSILKNFDCNVESIYVVVIHTLLEHVVPPHIPQLLFVPELEGEHLHPIDLLFFLFALFIG